MKTCLLAGGLALALAVTVCAIDPPPVTLASLDREVQNLTDQLRDATGKIASLQERLDTVENRLGDSFRPISPFDTVERRLDDIEKDIGDLKRR